MEQYVVIVAASSDEDLVFSRRERLSLSAIFISNAICTEDRS